MSRITHVLDTSAILAHYFDEPGARAVDSLWASGDSRTAVCAVTVAELRIRLSEEVRDEAAASEAADTYLNALTSCLPVDRATAEMAWQIKAATPDRLPMVDALIAATARVAGAVLVHRDPHMAAIPRGLVEQIVLPDA